MLGDSSYWGGGDRDGEPLLFDGRIVVGRCRLAPGEPVRALFRMATQADVRRIALALPDTEEVAGRFAFSVRNKGKLKGFVWVWMERIVPNKPRVANPSLCRRRQEPEAETLSVPRTAGPRTVRHYEKTAIRAAS